MENTEPAYKPKFTKQTGLNVYVDNAIKYISLHSERER